TQASAPFQRLRHNWLLILQLLMLALVVFALGRPYFAGNTKSSGLRVLILDASASMRSKDEKPSRFEKARVDALKWVDGLRDYDQMVVLQAGANTEVKQSATSDKTALRRALNACAATDSPTRLLEALKLAETLIRNQRDAEIHLFSDGALPDLGDFQNKNLPVIFHRLGVRGENLGVVSLDVRANPDDASQRAVFTSVGNFSTNSYQTELELRFNDQLIETRPVNLASNQTLPFVFLAPQSRDGVFTVQLKAKDDLDSDNQASIVSLMPQPMKVLLVTRGNRFLEKALRGPANVQLTVAENLTDDGAGFDLVALDDLSPGVWPKGNVLAIHIVNTNWFAGFGRAEAPAIVDWKNTHPLLRFVNLDNVQIAEALAVKTPTWGISLADSPQTPLIVTGEKDRQRILWIGFDTLQSTWPLRLSFPIFVANAMDWLNPASANASQFTVRAGDAFRLGLAQPLTSAQITKPDGSMKTVLLEPTARELVFGDTTQQGIYRVKAGTNDLVLCVNLMDAAESQTTPRSELPIGKYAKVKETTLRRANMELWRWIAGAGLLVLLFEWWYYHKRTA
ncbi:MAG TPA: VWA domain-containing protein, partial [Candidatus Eisenbacteria bacterium]|nr:VWA domain-containing protein [Candidatus Eisenbacteria bacterium]